MACPNEAELLDFMRAGAGHDAALTEHVATCDSCEHLLVAFAELSTSRGPAASTPADKAGERLPEPGEQLGRYQLEATLGRGAMGVVYLAHDPTLDRRVALKVLLESQRSPLEEARVLVEARAAARVQHPCLVGVYDVTTWHARVVLAMEYVDGPTLTRWLAEAPRGIDALTSVFVDIARGLAAVHAAGLRHCDVKPDNILIGDSGAKLADFGLALGPDHAGLAGLRGTPSYMAPELLRGSPPSAASDQYALCVSLFEAIAGQRPPSPVAATSPIVREAIDGARGDDPGDRPLVRPARMPRWMFQVVARGLSREPERRFARVADLAAALERGRHRTSRLSRAGGAVLVAAAVGAAVTGAVVARAPVVDPCPAPRTALARAWDPIKASVIVATLGVDGARVRDRLAAYGDAWLAAGVTACRATRVEHRYSDAVLDRRTQCLDRARSRFGALVERLAASAVSGSAAGSGETSRSSASSTDVALTAIDNLPTVAACDDVAALAAGELPLAPAVRAHVAAATAVLDAAMVAVDLRRPEQALDAVRDGHTKVAAVPPGPDARRVEADEHYITALALAQLDRRDEAVAAFERAYEAARAAADEDQEVKIALELAGLLAREPATRPAASAWLGRGRAVADRLGNELLGALVAERAGALAFASNDYPAAVRELRAAVDVRHRRYGEADQRTALTRSSLAAALGKTGAFDSARAELRAAIAGLVAARGNEHASLVTLWNTLGNVELAAGDLRAARTAFDEAYRRAVIAHGDTHTTVIALDINRASIAKREGNLAAAAAGYQRAAEALERSGRRNSAIWRSARQGLAQIANARSEFTTGRTIVEELIAQRLADPTPEPAALGSLRIDLATALTGERRFADADTALVAVRDAYAKVYGDRHPKTARVQLQRAANAHLAGDRARAERFVEPLADRTDLPPDIRADALWMLTNLIAARQPTRARKLATSALELARTAGETKVATEIEAWLRARGPN